MLRRTKAGPGRTVKQEQEEISRNHIQTFIYLSVRCCEKFLPAPAWLLLSFFSALYRDRFFDHNDDNTFPGRKSASACILVHTHVPLSLPHNLPSSSSSLSLRLLLFKRGARPCDHHKVASLRMGSRNFGALQRQLFPHPPPPSSPSLPFLPPLHFWRNVVNYRACKVSAHRGLGISACSLSSSDRKLLRDTSEYNY